MTKTNNGEDFWKRVAVLMDKNGMTQSDLSKRSGVRAQTISIGRQKNSLPSIINAEKIAKALTVSLDYLLHGGDDEPDTFFQFQVDALKDNPVARAIIGDLVDMNDYTLDLIRHQTLVLSMLLKRH